MNCAIQVPDTGRAKRRGCREYVNRNPAICLSVVGRVVLALFLCSSKGEQLASVLKLASSDNHTMGQGTVVDAHAAVLRATFDIIGEAGASLYWQPQAHNTHAYSSHKIILHKLVVATSTFLMSLKSVPMLVATSSCYVSSVHACVGSHKLKLLHKEA